MTCKTLLATGLGMAGGLGLLAAVPATALAATPAMPARTALRPIQRVAVDYPVIQLQEALDARGAHLAIDGIFGKRTDAALKTYQRDHGLVASGELDHATRASLSLLG